MALGAEGAVAPTPPAEVPESEGGTPPIIRVIVRRSPRSCPDGHSEVAFKVARSDEISASSEYQEVASVFSGTTLKYSEQPSDQHLVVDLDARARVLDLKRAIAESWALPPECQELTAGFTTLRDDDSFEDLSAEGVAVLPVTLCASVTGAKWDLVEGGAPPERQLPTLRTLSSLELKGGQVDIPTLAAVARRSEGKVRQEAMVTIGAVCPLGCQPAVDALAEGLEDVCLTVRRASKDALLRLNEQGDRLAADAALKRLEHQEWRVRQSAALVLAPSANRGEGPIMSALTARLQDENSRVRHAAMLALGKNVVIGRR